MSYDMSFIFLGVTTIIVSLILIPPLAKATIAPLLTSIVASSTKDYVESFIKVFYNVLEGSITLDNISIQPTYLYSLRFSLPAPMEFTKITIKKMKLQLPSFWGGKGAYSYRMPIVIKEFVIEGRIDHSFEKDYDEYLKRAVDYKISLANIATQLMLGYISRFQSSGSNSPPKTWVQKLTRSIVETVDLRVNKLTITFSGTEPATPVNKLHIESDLWTMKCTPNEEDLKTNRAMVFKNFIIAIDEAHVIRFPVLNMDLHMPDVYAVMYSPLPLPQKILGVKLVSDAMLTTLSPEVYTALMRYYICYLKYCAFLEQLTQVDLDRSVTELTIEDNQRYTEHFKWDDLTSQPRTNNIIKDLDSSMTIPSILNIREQVMKWEETLQKFGQDQVNFVDLHSTLATDAASFLGKDIDIQIGQWSIKFVETTCDDRVGDLVLSDLYMTMKTRIVDSLTLDLSYGIRNLILTTECPSMECQQSQLISHATVQPLFFGHLEQYKDSRMKVELNLESILIFAAKEPIEFFMLYLDRLQMGAQSAKLAAQDSGATVVVSTSNEVQPSTSNIATLKDSTCSLLGGALYDIEIRIIDMSVYLIPAAVEHIGSLLECQMSVVLDVEADQHKEKISLVVSDTSLSPRLYQAPKDVSGFPIIYPPTSSKSLLTPMTIITDYELKFLSDTASASGEETVPHLMQSVGVKIPDISLSFSQLNFATFWSAMMHLSKIETSTAEQRKNRLEAEEAAREAEIALQIKKRLDYAQMQFEEIDADGTKSIEVDELQMLLERAIVDNKLLSSELKELSGVIFNHIDKDGNGTIDFEEFEHFLVETMNVEHVRGYVDLFGGEYDCLDTVENKFGKILGFEKRDSIIDWYGYFNRLVKENSELFWSTYISETGAGKTTCNGQSPQLLQRKLTRLLQNFDAAQQCWSTLILPLIEDDVDSTWCLNRDTLMGGLVEFESAGKMILNQNQHEEIEIRGPVDSTSHGRLIVATNMSLGNFRVDMVDSSLPVDARRAVFVVDNVRCQFNMASDIGVIAYDVNAVSSEWAGTMGLSIGAECYSDLSSSMESIIEPWVVSIGALSKRGSEGFNLWAEAEKQFQINLSSSLLQLLKILPEILSGNLVVDDLPKIQRQDKAKPFQITNMTGVPLVFKPESENDINLAPHSVTSIEWPSRENCSLSIPDWGSVNDIQFPRFGPQEIVVRESNSNNSISLIALCRFDDLSDGSMSLKSNVYVSNLSTLDIDVQCLIHLAGFTSLNDKINKIPAGDHLALPISVFMGDTELYVKSSDSNSSWNTSVKLTNDMLFESHDDEQSSVKSPSSFELRKGDIVPIQNQRRSSKRVKILNSCVHLYRHIMSDNMIQWEITVYSPLVVQNSLPYDLEYVFMEYRMEKGVRVDLATIDRSLHESNTTFIVKSGCFGEIPGVSGQVPGYMSVRLLLNNDKSAWSKALLMMINSGLNMFTTDAEKCLFEENLTVNMERISLPDKPRVVKFSVPYWIYNKTALDLEYRLPDEENNKSVPATPKHPIFNQPIMLLIPNNRMSIRPLTPASSIPPSWTSFYSQDDIPPSVFFQTTNVPIWSDPINTTAVQTNGEVYSGSHVFGVDIGGLMGNFTGSVTVSLSPRYIIQNHTPFDIQFRAFATSDSDQIMNNKLLSTLDVYTLKSHANGTVYPFKLLNKESLSKCQKYLSMAMMDSTIWSSVISVNAVGDIYFPLKCTIRKREFIVKASIQILGPLLYIVLSDASSTPPYRVENFTMVPITLRQYEQKQSKVTLERGKRYAFAWDLAFVNEHKIEVEIQSQKYMVDIDSVGRVKSSGFASLLDSSRKYTLEVVPVGSTRVLRIVDTKLKQLDELRKQVPKNVTLTASWYATSIDIRLAGMGLSVLDGYPQEVLYFSMENILLRTRPQSLEWEVSIYHVQMDNMLYGARYPVVFCPVNSGYNGEMDLPFFKLIVERIETMSDAHGILKLMDISLQPMSVKLELEYLFKLLALMDPLFLSGTESISQNDLASKILVKPMICPEPIGIQSSDLLYFETFTIHETEFKLETHIQKDDLAKPLTSRSWLVNALNQLVGILGSKISGSPSFHFDSITKRHCFTSQSRLQSQLIQNYTREIIVQAYKLVGSMDLLGNPVGVVGDIGSGILSFLKVTGEELTGDSKTRGEGVKILGKTVATSTTGFVAKVTGSLDKFMDEVSDVTDTRQEKSNKKEHDNIVDGSINFAKNFGKGVAGVFTKPIEGAISGGVGGLVQGTVQGLAGPVVVVLKGVTQTTHALAQEASDNLEGIVPFQGRRRKELKFENKQLVKRIERTLMDLEIISASGLIAANAGKCNPICYVYLDDIKVFSTKLLFGSSNPEWHAHYRMELKPTTKRIKFIVKDNFTSFEEEIGKLEMTLKEFQDDFTPRELASSLSQWVQYNVTTPSGNEKHFMMDPTQITIDTSRMEKEYFLQAKTTLKSSNHLQVLVTVLEVSGLTPLKNLFGKNSSITPFVAVDIGGKIQKTTPKTGTQVYYKETFTFEWKPEKHLCLITVFDKSMLSDDLVGSAFLPLDINAPEMEITLDMQSGEKKHVNGRVTLKYEIVGLPSPDTPDGKSMDRRNSGRTAGRLKLYAKIS